jgi:hypothetical protein
MFGGFEFWRRGLGHTFIYLTILKQSKSRTACRITLARNDFALAG